MSQVREVQGNDNELLVCIREEMTSIIMKLNQLEKSQPGGKFAAQMLNPHLHHSFLAELCVKDRLLTSVADILGPDLVLVSTTLFTKYPAQVTSSHCRDIQ